MVRRYSPSTLASVDGLASSGDGNVGEETFAADILGDSAG